MVNKILFIIYVLYCFEVGLFLIVFPWTQLWDQNALLSYVPSLREYIISDYVRGAVSGLGIANLMLGFLELFHAARNHRRARMGSSDSLRHL